MKSLFICSYACAALYTIVLTLFWIDISPGPLGVGTEFLVLYIPSAMQFVYTASIHRLLLKVNNRENPVLDDLQPLAIHVRVNTGLRVLAFFSNVFWTLAILRTVIQPGAYIRTISNWHHSAWSYGVLLSLPAAVLAFPTILFNLRTFSLQKIVD